MGQSPLPRASSFFWTSHPCQSVSGPQPYPPNCLLLSNNNSLFPLILLLELFLSTELLLWDLLVSFHSPLYTNISNLICTKLSVYIWLIIFMEVNDGPGFRLRNCCPTSHYPEEKAVKFSLLENKYPLWVIPSSPQLRKTWKLVRTERWEASANKLFHMKPLIFPTDGT